MDVHESLSHTKWDCKYHSMCCSAYCDICGVPDYAELRAGERANAARRPGFSPHNQEVFSIAMRASGTLNWPDRRLGGTTAQSASSFSDGSTRK
jgi:hypothetical protein